MRSSAIVTCILFLVSQPSFPPPELKSDVLTFHLPDQNGDSVSSSDERFQDKVVLVDLWGTWCPPCRQAIPFLVELQRNYNDDGLIVVGIAFEEGETQESRRTKIRDFKEKFNINYLLLDAGGEPDSTLRHALPDIVSTKAFPTMFIIGRDGKVKYSKSGFLPADKEAIEAEVKHLLAD